MNDSIVLRGQFINMGYRWSSGEWGRFCLRTFSQELVLRLASTFSVIENIILISKVNIVTLLSEFPINLYILMST